MSQIIAKDLIKNLHSKEPIVCISAYTYPIAKLIDKFCDLILVGDSLGMTIYGMSDTKSVSMDMMINHGQAVKNAVPNALVIVDLPYGSYEKSHEQALENCKKIIAKTGCDGVKIEVKNFALVDTVKFLVNNGINVAAHVGLTPQNIDEFGGFKVQGKDDKSAQQIIDIAVKCEKAGAFCMFIEAVIESVATEIVEKLSIPTIGIGASAKCSGQVLVIDDILGINQDYKPKFTKQYDDLSDKITNAVGKFASEVKSHKFPSKEHCFFAKR